MCSLSPDVLMLSDTTALYIAAQHGYEDTVRALLSVGVRANIYYAMPVTGDMASPGNNGLMKYKYSSPDDDFLNEVTTINSEAANGATALHAAAENGHASVVEILLNHAKDLSTKTSRSFSDFVNGQSIGVTPLHLAAQYDRQHVASVLLRHGAAIDALASIDGTSALYHAISMRHKDVALFLVQAGADCLHSPSRQGQGSTASSAAAAAAAAAARRTSPLILAITQGRPLLAVLRAMLLLQPTSANHTDGAGLSALHMSARLEDKTALSLLLQHGGNLLAINADQDTLLHVAIAHDRLSTVRFLLKRFRVTPGRYTFFVLNQANKDGYTALHLAASECSRHGVLQLLVESLGDSLPSRAAFNVSVAGPLHIAAAKGCARNIASLLSVGFKASDVFKGRTVLITAIQYNRVTVVEQLLRNKDVSLQQTAESQSKFTDNPLLFAVMKGAYAIVQVLLDGGADCNIFVVLSSDPSAEPSSLLDIAQRRRDFDTAKILSLHPSCTDVHLEL
jgi:ankyrin repeat protein